MVFAVACRCFCCRFSFRRQIDSTHSTTLTEFNFGANEMSATVLLDKEYIIIS